MRFKISTALGLALSAAAFTACEKEELLAPAAEPLVINADAAAPESTSYAPGEQATPPAPHATNADAMTAESTSYAPGSGPIGTAPHAINDDAAAAESTSYAPGEGTTVK